MSTQGARGSQAIHIILTIAVVAQATLLFLQNRLIREQTEALSGSNDRYEALQKNAHCMWLDSSETTGRLCGCDPEQNWMITWDGETSTCKCLEYIVGRREEMRECRAREKLVLR